MNPGTAVLGYARVSTEEQADSGLGLAAQEAAIRKECDRRGWTLLGIVRDEGVSAKSLERPGLRVALERVVAGDAAGIVSAKLDRLSRSVGDFARLLEHSHAEGYSLVVLDPLVDTTTPWGRAMAQMSSVFAELERELAAQRTREALAARRAQGKPISRPAVADRPELAERIKAMRDSGMTLQAIADRLNHDRVPTLRGAAGWGPSSVRAACGYKRPNPRRASSELPTAGRRRESAAASR